MIYNDYPLAECAEAADKLIQQGGTIFQKWSCRHCGARQTMEQENRFFKSGKCDQCGQVTVIKECNYLLVMGP